MQRLPVWKVVRESYAFLFDNFGTIVRLTWFPLLLAAIGDRLFERWNEEDGSTLVIVASVPYVAFSMLLYSIVWVAMTEQVLAPRQVRSLIYFRVGSKEWQLFRVTVGCTLLAILAMALAAIVFILPLAYFSPPADGDNAWRRWLGAIILVVLVPLLFIGVRCLFFLPVSVVVAKDHWLVRSYELSGGNFWRITGIIMVCTAAPSVVFTGVIEFFDRFLAAGELARVALSLMGLILLAGVSNSAPAFAYRALTSANDEPIQASA